MSFFVFNLKRKWSNTIKKKLNKKKDHYNWVQNSSEKINGEKDLQRKENEPEQGNLFIFNQQFTGNLIKKTTSSACVFSFYLF